jgi:hypothetical protein
LNDYIHRANVFDPNILASLVRLRDGVGDESRPSTFKIAKGKGCSVKEVADAMVDKLEPTAIASQETHDFFFWERRAVDAPRSRSVWFFIYWRKASSTWLWQIPIVLGAQQSTTNDD